MGEFSNATSAVQNGTWLHAAPSQEQESHLLRQLLLMDQKNKKKQRMQKVLPNLQKSFNNWSGPTKASLYKLGHHAPPSAHTTRTTGHRKGLECRSAINASDAK